MCQAVLNNFFCFRTLRVFRVAPQRCHRQMGSWGPVQPRERLCHRMAKLYSEAQECIQRMHAESPQQKLALESELQSSKHTFEIQKAKRPKKCLSKGWLRKSRQEIRERQHMLQELRIMFQEQTEQARKMVADYKSLKNEFEHRKSSDKGNERKDGRMSKGWCQSLKNIPISLSFGLGKPIHQRIRMPS